MRNTFLGHIVCYMNATHIVSGNVNVGKSKEARFNNNLFTKRKYLMTMESSLTFS